MESTMTRNNNTKTTRTLVMEQTDSLRNAGKTDQEIVSWLEVTFIKEKTFFSSFESLNDLAEHVNIPSWKFHIA